jgi:translation elongation factor EF-Ts
MWPPQIRSICGVKMFRGRNCTEKNIYEVQAREGGKPERIVSASCGKLEKFFEEICLLEQPFVKDPI